jgi:hypothetical protein
MRKTLLSAALVTLLAAGCFPVPPTPPAPKADSAAASAPTPPPAAAPAPPEDPYSECALVRKWLGENLGDPGSLQVISWKRESYTVPDPKDPQKAFDAIRMVVKYRAKNAYGALAVTQQSFWVRDGEVIGH